MRADKLNLRKAMGGLAGVLVSGILVTSAHAQTEQSVASAGPQTGAQTVGEGNAVSGPLAQKASDADALLQAAADQGYVRVIVHFETPAAAQDLSPDQGVIDRVKQSIDRMQNALIGAHLTVSPQSYERRLTRFALSPMFAANVSEAELQGLASDPRVVRINPDRQDSPMLNESVPLIGMDAAFGLGATGSGTAVAVLDTGIQRNHKFFGAEKVVAEACFSAGGGGTSLCPNGQNTQVGTGASEVTIAACEVGASNICDHGPHVAGIAAGLNSNQATGEPESGVAKDADIVSVQVFTRNGSSVGSWVSDQILALEWVYQHALTPANGVQTAAINMSLGSGQHTAACDDTDSRTNIINNLRNAGVATIIASGNDEFTNAVAAPACISTAVTVASSTKGDDISVFSNMSDLVDLMAPGGSSVQQALEDVLSAVPGNSFSFKAGTSMAAPHVAGAFAAIRSACPEIAKSAAGNDLILGALQDTGVEIDDDRSGGSHSKNRIAVADAVDEIDCDDLPPARVVSDFDGDGKSDVLFRHMMGGTHMWLMDGTSVSTSASIADIGTSWQIAGNGDFNNNGRSDILWRHNAGAVHMWLMNGTTIAGSHHVGRTTTSWQIAGIGDFNGNGSADILWRHQNGGVHVWLMDGPNVAGSHRVSTTSTSWQIVGIGDFNGNGRSDILWRHHNGHVHMWLMNGQNVVGSQPVASTSTAWSIDGVGDFDGNGKSDIVWRHSGGGIHMWMMDGPNVAGSQSVGKTSTNWQIATVGDYNGNGRSDLLWHRGDGSVHLWFMDGSNVVGSGPAPSIGSDWSIVNDGQGGAETGAAAAGEAGVQPASAAAE